MGFLRRCPLPKQVLLVTSHTVAAREKEREEDTEMPDPPLGHEEGACRSTGPGAKAAGD